LNCSNIPKWCSTTHLLGERVHEGILGSFRFDKNGDIDPGGVSIYRVVRATLGLTAPPWFPLALSTSNPSDIQRRRCRARR
jgi:hypothetical protein